MRKKITSLALALIFSVSMAGVSLAAKCKGEVTKVEGGEMVIKVDGKCKIKPGDKVTIKPKKAAIEGC